MRRVASALLISLLVACGAGSIPKPTALDTERAQEKFPGTERADLERARKLLLSRCSSCHRVPKPEKHPPGRWPELIEAMVGPAKLSDTEREDILRFMIVMSAR